MISQRVSLRIGAVVASVTAALLVAACGGSSNSSSSTSASASSKPASSNSAALMISTAKGSVGTYLTGSAGRALYLFAADHSDKSMCSGTCAQNWPPVTASSMPRAAAGVNASDFGTTTRSDGAKQVTYKGHPLYYYLGDPSSGTTSGEGSSAFGAEWWLVTPAGVALTKNGGSAGGSAGASTSTSSSSSSGGTSGGSSGGSSGGWG